MPRKGGLIRMKSPAREASGKLEKFAESNGDSAYGRAAAIMTDHLSKVEPTFDLAGYLQSARENLPGKP